MQEKFSAPWPARSITPSWWSAPTTGPGTAGGAPVDAGGPRRCWASCAPSCGGWMRCLSVETRLPRGQHSHVVFKFKNADYRTVTADASNLFQSFGGDEQLSGWDAQRGCRWTLRKTLDHYAGCPVQVVELPETYPKRQRDRTVTSWIVTTGVTPRGGSRGGSPTVADRKRRFQAHQSLGRHQDVLLHRSSAVF